MILKHVTFGVLGVCCTRKKHADYILGLRDLQSTTWCLNQVEDLGSYSNGGQHLIGKCCGEERLVWVDSQI